VGDVKLNLPAELAKFESFENTFREDGGSGGKFFWWIPVMMIDTHFQNTIKIDHLKWMILMMMITVLK